MRTYTLIIVAISTAVFAAIGYGVYHLRASSGGVPTLDQYEGKLQELNSELKTAAATIEGLQGNSECKTSADCRIVGLGPKLCEGYLNFLIYSIRDVSAESKLREAVAHFNELADEKNRLSYKVLSCGQNPAPVTCMQKRCAPETH